MGKGDRRSKRGKIFRGTFGKRRPKPEKVRKKVKAGRRGDSVLSVMRGDRLAAGLVPERIVRVTIAGLDLGGLARKIGFD